MRLDETDEGKEMSNEISYKYQPNGKGGWTVKAVWVNYRKPSYESNNRALQFSNASKDINSRRYQVWEYFAS